MKQEEKTERTREKILCAAMAEFGARGYAASSINNVCGAGIPKGLVYHNFENKDALYLASVQLCFDRLTQFLKEQNFELDIRRYMAARNQFFDQNPDAAHIFFEATLYPPVQLTDQIKGLRTQFDAFNRTLFEAILAALPLRSGVTEEDALEYFTLMQTMYHSYFCTQLRRGDPIAQVAAAHEARLFRLLDFMLYGIVEGGTAG